MRSAAAQPLAVTVSQKSRATTPLRSAPSGTCTTLQRTACIPLSLRPTTARQRPV